MLRFRGGRSSSPKPGALTAFIDDGSQIEGTCVFTGTVMLNGTFKGEIASADTLIIGEKGVINGSIRASTVLVSGEVVGDVIASQRIDLRGKARVLGDLTSPILVIEEGVLFEGQCRMTTSPVAETTSPATASRDLAVVPLKR